MYAAVTKAVSDFEEKEGREAFRKHGVAGYNRHSYPAGSPEQMSFLKGFSLERGAACERSLIESRAYYELSVRENAKDREWAEKLFRLKHGGGSAEATLSRGKPVDTVSN